jgi:hypothetical protein
MYSKRLGASLINKLRLDYSGLPPHYCLASEVDYVVRIGRGSKTLGFFEFLLLALRGFAVLHR